MRLRDDDLLNLDDAPDFISEPPPISAAELIEHCQKMLPYWNRIRYSKPEPEFLGESFRL